MTVRILQGDCRDVLKTLPDDSVHCVVTSPPYYGLRDYRVSGQIGLERSPDEFVSEMVNVFYEVKRVLRSDGTLWLNLGDTYASGEVGRHDYVTGDMIGPKRSGQKVRQQIALDTGLRPKNLIGIPWRVAFALQATSWILRSDIIWAKPNPMPESVRDRCTKAHEYLFMFAKSERYYYDAKAIAEIAVTNDLRRPYGSPGANQLDPRGKQGEGKQRAGKALTSPRNDGNAWNEADGRGFIPKDEYRNKRSVWEVPTAPYGDAHFATFPPALIEPCILAGCPAGGTVLDPFGGAGTTGLVADRLQRNAILIELNPEYAAMAKKRIQGDAPLFAEVA